jgi:hypothetical protein
MGIDCRNGEQGVYCDYLFCKAKHKLQFTFYLNKPKPNMEEGNAKQENVMKNTEGTAQQGQEGQAEGSSAGEGQAGETPAGEGTQLPAELPEWI